MQPLRIALAQVNATVGDLDGNAALVASWTARAAAAGAHLVVFPEMVLTGYPVEDLALRESFAAASRQALTELAARLDADGHGSVAAVVSYLDRDDVGPRDAAAVLYDGRVVATQFKHHLPNYGVFDERRLFKAGNTLDIVRLHGLEIGMVICEDIWQEGGPISALGAAGVDLVVSPNASPYERHKDDQREPLIARRAAEAGAPLVYVNMVGGQDDLVFDGDSMVVSASGALLTRSPQFVEHLTVMDLDLPSGAATRAGDFEGFSVRRVTLSDEALAPCPPLAAPATVEPLSELEEMWRALSLGLCDYVRKNG